MNVTKNGDNHAQTSRRRFLARNVLTIGAILATSAVAKPALAGPPPGRPSGPPPGRPSGPPPGRPSGPPQCFLKGTRIRTTEGERKVENLAVGDLVPTRFGGVRPVQWVSRYAHKKSDPTKPWERYARPVRITRSALAPGVPHADLFLASGHALFIDDVLVPAGDLINGTTITLYAADEFDELKFFHIKFEAHDVIYAEGAQCETQLTVRETASNFAEYSRLYGAPNVEEACCAPLLYYKGRRGQIKSRVRSAISPWFDCREKIDVIRDRLEERGIVLCEQTVALS